MTLEEFKQKYRAQMLNYMTECFAARHAKPSEFGMLVDNQMRRCAVLLTEMHGDLTNGKPEKANGK